MSGVLLGLDPSVLRCGWAAVDLDTGAPVACGTEHLTKTDDGWLDPASVREALTAIRYTFASGLPTEVSVVYIESGYIGPNRTGAARHCEALGQTVQAVNRRWPWAIIQRITPAEWKQACGLKGNASKAAVMAYATVFMDQARLGPAFRVVDGQDAADALCIATAGWHRNQEILDAQGAAT